MGPLSGFRVVELAGMGPGPFAGMLLADMGAEVIRIDRPNTAGEKKIDVFGRGKKSIAVNLKDPAGVQTVLDLCESAHILIEGYRPGVTERLGLGPEDCWKANPALVYGRMTGWGQDGPLAQAAGHDINYIALAGALHAMGPEGGKPQPPLNLVGDFGGGGMFLAFGVLAAVLEAQKSGKGQVVDTAMVDGTGILMGMFYAHHGRGTWVGDRGKNALSGGNFYYDSYETSDGKYIALGSIEPQFYAELLEKIGLADDEEFKQQRNADLNSTLKSRLTDLFKTKTREQWCDILEGSDACFSPVLALEEVAEHPHNKARNAQVELDGVMQPAPAPRFSRTSPTLERGAPVTGADGKSVLEQLGYADDKIASLLAGGVVADLEAKAETA